jgi:hypothetical protein
MVPVLLDKLLGRGELIEEVTLESLSIVAKD